MASPLRLLIVEDRPDDAELLLLELKRAGYEPTWTRVETPADFVAALADEPDIVVCDYSLPTMTAPDALRILGELRQDVPLIVVSGVMDEDTCVTSLRLGAVDYLLKDRLVRLGAAVEHALAGRRLVRLERSARRQSRETADILRGVVDHAPAAICVRDAGGQILLKNAEYDRVVPDDRRSRLTSIEQACLDGADTVQSEERVELDGVERTYLAVRYPVVDGTGRRFAVNAIFVDITAQKQVETELRELDRLKGEFVATVSHELRTPLTSICGYADLMLAQLGTPTGSDPDAVRRVAEVIDRNGRRLLALVDDLLTLSQVDTGIADATDEHVDLADLLDQVALVLRPALESAGVTVARRLDADLPELVGDRSQLERVLLNLMSNAVKFSAAGGTVTVGVAVDGARMRIEVQDTGIGIPAHEQEQLFTRFFRTEEAIRRAIPGTGLGLAVVRAIVERHGGSVGVRSASGRGTTMTVELPIRVPALSGARGADARALSGARGGL